MYLRGGAGGWAGLGRQGTATYRSTVLDTAVALTGAVGTTGIGCAHTCEKCHLLLRIETKQCERGMGGGSRLVAQA